jgi:hypothetical protein
VTTLQQERDWTERLERIGETSVRADLQLRQGTGIGFNSDQMFQVAAEWLRQKEQEREQRESRAFAYIKWTFVAAVAAVLVGIVGIVVTVVLAR